MIIIYTLDKSADEVEWGRIHNGSIIASSTVERKGANDFENYIDALTEEHDVDLDDPQSLLRRCDTFHTYAVYFDPDTNEFITDPDHPLVASANN